MPQIKMTERQPVVWNVPMVVSQMRFEQLLKDIEARKMVTVPWFPGLLCLLSGARLMLTLENYGIVQVDIEDFYKDDGK